MRTLAAFAAACVILLGVAIWQLRPLGGPGEGQESLQPSSQQQATPAAAPARGSVEARDLPAAAPPAPCLVPGSSVGGPVSQPTVGSTSAGDEERSRAAAATQSAIRWADDAQRERKERFIELRERLATEPEDETALEAALVLARELEWHNEACDLLARLVQLRPTETGRRFELATLLMQLERWVEALPHLRAVVQQEPDNSPAWYNLAIAHQALGHLHDARAAWGHVIELMPQNPDAYAHRGEVLLDLHDWAAAVQDLETAQRLEAGSLDVALNLALALSKLGRLEDARAMLLPVVAQNPEHVPVLNRLAEIAWALYQADPATHEAFADETLNYCLRSLAIQPDQPEIRKLLESATAAGE